MNKNLNATIKSIAGDINANIGDMMEKTIQQAVARSLAQYKEEVLKQYRLELVKEVNNDFDMLLAFTGRTREELMDTNNKAALELIRLREEVEKKDAMIKQLSDSNKDLWDRVETLEMENQDLIKDKRRVLMKEDKPECCKAGHCGTEKCKGNCKKKVDKAEPKSKELKFEGEDLANLLALLNGFDIIL